ncbi:rod shape-determining protein MreC [uncultured Neglectibacter sp.]|uniref:rod shape-determining protein MreC n=1 Tax=uncultured Neglectibacter sp. TaxID=1924108 RepID=UPI0034DE0B05
MKDFFKSSSFKVLIITVVVLLGLIIFTASAGGSFLASLLGFVSSPMQGVATTVTENVTEFLDLDGLTKDELKNMVTGLQDKNAQLQQKLADYEEIKQENEQLKQQLEITSQRPENKSLAASVIGRDPNDVFSGFSIDKGTLEGISVGDPVITNRGLVGIVTQAYATTSKVSCLLSEDVKVAAVCIERQESGVVTSNIMTASTGLLRFNYLSGDTKLQEGDIITTSGAGRNYPEGILIGEVKSVEKSENDISKYAVVQPCEDISAVKDVFVIVSFPGKGEEIPDVDVTSNPQGGEDAE